MFSSGLDNPLADPELQQEVEETSNQEICINKIVKSLCCKWLKILLSAREDVISISGPAKSCTVANASPPLRRFCAAQRFCRGDGTRLLLHALA